MNNVEMLFCLIIVLFAEQILTAFTYINLALPWRFHLAALQIVQI